jgi:pyruvate dehydrogenase E1 component alpha subunit
MQIDKSKFPIIYGHDPRKGEMFQVVNEEGEIVNPDFMPDLTDEQLFEIYTWLIRMRISDEKANNLQRQGRMGTYPSIYGQEACQIGAVWPQEKSDWLVPTFRENGMMWMKGVPLEQTYLYWIGNEKGSEFAEDLNMLPVAIPVGSHTIHAAGIGWAERIKGGNNVAVCSFSDGATSEGDFHAAMNFAGVFKTKCVFFCQNNQYAISTHRNIQTASDTIAEKAFGYGLPGVMIDGNDVFAVIATMTEALKLAREFNTTTLIEAVTYRLGAHTTSDNPKIYREDSEVEEWAKKEPLIRLDKLLRAKGILDDEKAAKVEEDARQEVSIAAKKALEAENPKITDMFDYLLSETYPELEEQKQQLIEETNE